MHIQSVHYSNFVELLRDRANHHPQHTAYIFLKDGEMESGRITYQELEQQARWIAAHLSTCMVPGDRALLVYPYEASLEFIVAFLGCLYAGIVAVPSHPPRNRYSIADLRARLTSSQASVVLSTKSLLPRLKKQLSSDSLDGAASSCVWLATDEILTHKILPLQPDSWQPPPIDGNTLAFLQYTSGSTGAPKGVMITHGCLLHNQHMLQLAFGHTQQSIGVGWLPLFHDMGLIGNVLQALYLGGSCVLMSPIAFVQKPVRWLQAISRYQATTSGGPNFAYDLLCQHVTDQQRNQLDLSHWQVAFSGAEPVRADTIDRFVEQFAACGFRREAFYPCYGMAEATLFVAGGQKTEPPVIKHVDEKALEHHQVVRVDRPSERTRTLVSCGRAWLDGTLVIADPHHHTTCAADRVGEIWVAGSGIGKGYWQQPEETDRTFGAYLKDTGKGPFLRTGDLGFIWDGQVFITGRLNEVMIFWGFNHYPQQIEQTVAACHPAFHRNHGAAFSISSQGEDKLVVLQEVERRYRECAILNDVVEAIRWAVFEKHFVDVSAIALLKPGSLPKTPSGKIQRHLCRTKFLDGSLEVLEQWRSADPHSDPVSLMQRYFNPIIHLKRYATLMRGQLRHFLFSFKS